MTRYTRKDAERALERMEHRCPKCGRIGTHHDNQTYVCQALHTWRLPAPNVDCIHPNRCAGLTCCPRKLACNE